MDVDRRPRRAGPAGRGVERRRHHLPVALLPAPRGSGAAGAHRRRAPVAISATSAFAGFYGDNRHVLDHVRRADRRPRADGPARRGRVGGGGPDAVAARAVDRGRPRRPDHRCRGDGSAEQPDPPLRRRRRARRDRAGRHRGRRRRPPTRGTARAARRRASRPKPCPRRSREHGRDRVGVAPRDGRGDAHRDGTALRRCPAARTPTGSSCTPRCTRAPSPILPRRRRGTSSSTASSPPPASTPTCSGPSSARSTCSTTPTRCSPTRRCSPRPAPLTRRRTNGPPQPELGPPRDELLAVMAAACGVARPPAPTRRWSSSGRTFAPFESRIVATGATIRDSFGSGPTRAASAGRGEGVDDVDPSGPAGGSPGRQHAGQGADDHDDHQLRHRHGERDREVAAVRPPAPGPSRGAGRRRGRRPCRTGR